MKIVIAGGSGFLGTALAWAWAEEGHDVRILTRAVPAGQAQHESGTGRPGITRVGWTPDGTRVTVGQELERADALINLAGESIAGGRWTAARKQVLRNSRLRATRSLVEALAATREPPHTFVAPAASATTATAGARRCRRTRRRATTFSRVCASIGSRTRCALRVPASAWSRCARVSCSRSPAGRSRR
jgi:NAD dependent epimerase/dehydratase family enzyme